MSTPLIDPTAPGNGTFEYEEQQLDPEKGAKPSSTWWFQKEELREYRTSILVSVIMLLVGAVLLLTGIVFGLGVKDRSAGIVCIITGLLMFIPGLYYTGYAYFAGMAFQGFNVNDLKYFRLSK